MPELCGKDPSDSGARCKKCGKPVGSEEEFCRDCSRTRHSFDRGFAPYGYHGELEASLMRFKYHERQEYADFMLTRRFSMWESRSREEIRGARSGAASSGKTAAARLQSGGGICRKAGRRNGTSHECPPDPPCEKNKTPERAWSRRAAEKPGGAFALAKPGQMKYCRILLVDDIYTTEARLMPLRHC